MKYMKACEKCGFETAHMEDHIKSAHDGLADFTGLLSCRCKDKYSIEEHGKGYAIYWGRCQHRHGANIALLTECSRKDLIEYFEKALNGEAR